jgi:hypothetical protein
MNCFLTWTGNIAETFLFCLAYLHIWKQAIIEAMADIIQKIQACYKNDDVVFTRHAIDEMKQEEFGRIYETEVSEVVESGAIIIEYPDDTPYPSYLIYGRTQDGRPIHLVCAYSEQDERIIIVTVYF